MDIRIWGCRGSITTPGPHTLRYGGNSTCLEVRSASNQVFVIDAGSGVRNLGKALLSEPAISDLRFFFTHSHWDHLAGFPFFVPAYLDRYTFTFCSGPHGEGSIYKYVSHQMEAPYFPVDFGQLKAQFNFRCENPAGHNCNCPLGGLECRPFPLNHPNGGQGYKFMEQGKTMVFLTDNELGFDHQGGLPRHGYIELCRGADLLLHDAQYTDEEYRYTRGWGHSTYREAVELAMEAGVKRLGLFHHDPDRTDDDLDRQVEACRKEIDKSGVSLECFACSEGMSITL